MELEAIVGSVIELGEMLDVPMPNTRAVYAAAKLLGRSSCQGRGGLVYQAPFGMGPS